MGIKMGYEEIKMNLPLNLTFSMSTQRVKSQHASARLECSAWSVARTDPFSKIPPLPHSEGRRRNQRTTVQSEYLRLPSQINDLRKRG